MDKAVEFSVPNKKNIDLQIQQIEYKDLQALSLWIQSENWTPITLEELELWYSAYPSCFLGVYDSSGQLISHIFNRSVDEKTAFIELFITEAEHRGKGIGSSLIQHALKRHPGRQTVLVSVRGKELFYNNRGLKPTSYTIVRMFQLRSTGDIYTKHRHLPFRNSKTASDEIQIKSFANDANAVQLILDYDYSLHGKDRKALIHAYSMCNRYVCLYASDSNGKVFGFIVIAKTKNVNKVEAFCADSQRVAYDLLISCFPLCDTSLGFNVAFSNKNRYLATNLYTDIFDIQGKAPFEENVLSTSGDLDPSISWDKIYSASGLAFMGFF